MSSARNCAPCTRSTIFSNNEMHSSKQTWMQFVTLWLPRPGSIRTNLSLDWETTTLMSLALPFRGLATKLPGSTRESIISSINKFCNKVNILWNAPRDPSCLDTNQVFGLILNISNETKIGPISLPLNRRHWFAIKEIKGDFYNLDSKLDAPLIIGKVWE